VARRGNGALVAAGTSGSPVLKHGPMPPAADWGVNAPGFGNRALVAAATESLERGGAGRRGNGALVAAGSSGSPVLKHGPMPPAAEWGVNAPGFGNRALVAAAANCWRAVARGGAGIIGTLQRGATREWSVGCSWIVWFTRAQARAYSACGGLGRKRPWIWESSAGCGRRELLERGGAGRRGNGALVAAGSSGSPVLKHGPIPPAAAWGVNAPLLPAFLSH
jgi:hypothetical protein